MADVFISYSREDKKFVQKLFSALKAANREAWVDWDDIPPSAKWIAEIYAGIDAADTFVFVLSPDSISSEICFKEVAYAVQHNKRIIPLLYRTVDPKQVVESLRELNWIYFRKDDDFNTAFQALLAALDTDLAYWHLAARLLTRAKLWENKQHDTNVLLRGDELTEAEQWRDAGIKKEPRPTLLHVQFINASRHTATSRQRRTISFLSVVSVIMLILTLLSFFFSQVAQARQAEAITQRNEAIRQRNVAITRQAHLLAAQVNAALRNNQPDLALLLSLKAVQTLDDNETRSSLIQALEYSPHIAKVLHGHNDVNEITQTHGNATASGVTGLVFSHDGQTLWSSGANDGNIIRWSIANGWKRHPLALSQFRHVYGVGGLALSPNERLLASIGVDGVWLWDAHTGEQLAELERHTDTVTFGINQLWVNSPLPIVFSPDGKVLVASKCAGNPCSQAEIFLWDVASRKSLSPSPIIHSGPVQDIVFSPDGKVLALSGCSQFALHSESVCIQGQIELWDATTWKPLGPPLIGHTGSIFSVAFSPDGKMLASGGGDNSIILWNVAKRQRDGVPLTGHANSVSRLAFSPDGSILASASQDKTIILWDVASHKPISTPFIGHGTEIVSLAFSPDGQQLVSGDAHNEIIIWNVGDDTPISRRLRYETQIERVAFNPDGTMFATGGTDGKIILWEVATRKPIEALLTYNNQCERISDKEKDFSSCFIVGLAYSHDGKILASATRDGTILLWDMATKRLIVNPLKENIPCASFFCGEGDIASMALSPDGKLVAAGGCATLSGPFDSECSQGQIWLWDVTTGQIIRRLKGQHDQVTGITFSSDGRLLASASEDQTVILWNIASGQRFGKFFTGQDSVAFRPDGQTLASYNVDDTVKLWDTQTSNVTTQFVTPGTNHNRIAFVSNIDRAIFISNEQAAEQLVASNENHGHIAFSPNGKLLAVGTWDHTVTVWDVDSHQPIVPSFQDPGQVNDITFSPDGKQLISVDDNGYTIFWNLNLASWQDRACEIANRNFTMDELEQFSPDTPQVCEYLPVDASVVQGQLTQAQSAAQTGHIFEAAQHYKQAAQWAIKMDDASLNNIVCLEGSTDQLAWIVLSTCNQAVVLEPDDGNYRDSRGIALALTKDFSGAIEDFKFFIKWVKQYDLYHNKDYVQQRQIWIQKMEAGHNPFNTETLNAIRKERLSEERYQICFLDNFTCQTVPANPV